MNDLGTKPPNGKRILTAKTWADRELTDATARASEKQPRGIGQFLFQTEKKWKANALKSFISF